MLALRSWKRAEPGGMAMPLLLLLAVVGRVSGHEHHTDEIPDGQAISAEPIVCIRPQK